MFKRVGPIAPRHARSFRMLSRMVLTSSWNRLGPGLVYKIWWATSIYAMPLNPLSADRDCTKEILLPAELSFNQAPRVQLQPGPPRPHQAEAAAEAATEAGAEAAAATAAETAAAADYQFFMARRSGSLGGGHPGNLFRGTAG